MPGCSLGLDGHKEQMLQLDRFRLLCLVFASLIFLISIRKNYVFVSVLSFASIENCLNIISCEHWFSLLVMLHSSLPGHLIAAHLLGYIHQWKLLRKFSLILELFKDISKYLKSCVSGLWSTCSKWINSTDRKFKWEYFHFSSHCITYDLYIYI